MKRKVRMNINIRPAFKSVSIVYTNVYFTNLAAIWLFFFHEFANHLWCIIANDSAFKIKQCIRIRKSQKIHITIVSNRWQPRNTPTPLEPERILDHVIYIISMSEIKPNSEWVIYVCIFVLSPDELEPLCKSI